MSASKHVAYASRVTGVNFEKILVWGGVALAVYFVVWPALSTLFLIKDAAGAAIQTSRDALASGLYAVFGPTLKNESLFYSVRFPDGQIHSVPSMAVASDGSFTNANLTPSYAGDGKRYRMLIDTRVKSGNNKTALPL